MHCKTTGHGILSAVAVLCAVNVLAPMSASAQSGTWSALTPPTLRIAHTAIYDPIRDRMVIMGGHTDNVARRDMWTLSLSGTPTWEPQTPIIAPIQKRYSHTAIYDPVRDRMIVFGGRDEFTPPAIYQDVWVVNLAGSPTWTQLAPSGTPPSARYDHAAIYDPVRDRMIVSGGLGTPAGDVWALSLSGTPTWTQLAPSGTPPPALYGHSAIYDPAGDRMILFGGVAPPGFPSNAVWSLSLSGTPTWAVVTPSGTPPAARYHHTAIYQPGLARMIVDGGDGQGPSRDDTWALTLSGSPEWSLVPASPALAEGRSQHSAIYDPLRDRMLVFGRRSSTGQNDVQGLSLDVTPGWSVVAPGVIGPQGYYSFFAAAYDPGQKRAVVFGGNANGTVNDAGYAAFNAGPTPSWAPLYSTGAAPSWRRGFSMIRDVTGSMVIFGGQDVAFGTELNEIWVAAASGPPIVWRNVTPNDTPPALSRHNHSAIYDAALHRMVVFGGFNSAGVPLQDTWSIDLNATTPTWTELAHTALPGPGARGGHTAIYRPLSNHMMVFGGAGDFGVWWFRLTPPEAWENVTGQGGDAGVPRSYHAAVYDPGTDRMIVFGGMSGLSYLNDALSCHFTLDADYGWHRLSPTGNPPSPRAFVGAAYLPNKVQMQIFGGFDGSFDNNVMGLTFPELLDVPPAADLAGRGLLKVLHNPAHRAVDLAISGEWLRGANNVRIVDVLGRVVWSTVVAPGGVGERALHWDGSTRDGRRAEAGVYFAMPSNREVRPARFVLLN